MIAAAGELATAAALVQQVPAVALALLVWVEVRDIRRSLHLLAEAIAGANRRAAPHKESA